MKLRLALLTTALFAAAPAHATIVVATTGSDQFGCLGLASFCAQDFGQTFVAPTGNTVLSSATVYAGSNGAASVNVAFRLFAWDGSQQTGSALFDSGSQTLTSTAATALTFAPNITLTEGQQYVAILSAAGVGNTDLAEAYQVVNDNGGYADGVFGFQAVDGSGAFTIPSTTRDAVFSFTFNPSETTAPGGVPEPATWLTMILGFGLTGAALRKARGIGGQNTPGTSRQRTLAI